MTLPPWLVIALQFGAPLAVLFGTIANLLRKPDGEVPARGIIPSILLAFADFFSVVSKPGTVGVAGALGVPGALGRAHLPLLPSFAKRNGVSPTTPALVLALLSVYMAVPGCAFGKALGASELGKLPQTLQAAIACVTSIAAAAAPGADANQAIDACVSGLGGEQAGSVVDALIAWFKSLVPSHGQAAPGTLRAIQVLEGYKAAHPKSASAPRAIHARASSVDLVAADLLVQLKERDARPLDLALVARGLATKYGDETAETAILLAWRELTRGAPEARAGDVFWLKEQPARVRDVGWIIANPGEWVRP